MTSRSARLLRGVTLLLLVAAPACGGGSGSSSTTTTGAPAVSTTTPSAADTSAAVRSAYETLFDLANPAVDPKLAVVEDGPALRATFQQELATPLAKEAAGATVSSVTLESAAKCTQEQLPSPCAEVTYNITSPNGKPLFPSAATGWAVYVSSHWLVAKITICGLLSLASSGKTLAGC